MTLSSPLTRIRTLELRCPVDGVEQIEAIVQISSVRRVELVTDIERRPLIDVLQAGVNITQLTVYQ